MPDWNNLTPRLDGFTTHVSQPVSQPVAQPVSQPVAQPAAAPPTEARRRLEDRGRVDQEKEEAMLRHIRQRVTDAVTDRGLLSTDAMRSLVQDIASSVFNAQGLQNRSQRQRLLDELLSYIGKGYGPLQPLLAIPAIEEIMVNRYDEVWIAVTGQPKQMMPHVRFRDETDLLGLVQRLAADAGRQFNFREPIVDAELPDGNRLNAILAGVATRGTCATIRVHKSSADRPSVADMEEQGMIPRRDQNLGLFGSEYTAEPYVTDRDAGDFLRLCVRNRINILFVGPTGTGKTTVMDAFLRLLPELIDPSMRIVTVEDVPELSDATPNIVRLQARRANSENVGLVSMDQLVMAALRMRPDIIVVGEVRGIEGAAFITALNTGHEGSITCIHAQTPHAALNRLEGLLRSATGFDERLCREYVTALQLIVQIGRDSRHGDRRALHDIVSLDGYDPSSSYRITPLYAWSNGRFLPTGNRPSWASLLRD